MRSGLKAVTAAVVLGVGASVAGATPLPPAGGSAAAPPAVEPVQWRKCNVMKNVWYSYPCINGWSYICQHKSWGPSWGCANTRRCHQRERRCR